MISKSSNDKNLVFFLRHLWGINTEREEEREEEKQRGRKLVIKENGINIFDYKKVTFFQIFSSIERQGSG